MAKAKTTWQHAADIPRTQRGFFLARANHNDRPCEHGHMGCSDREGGPCSNELASIITEERIARGESAGDE